MKFIYMPLFCIFLIAVDMVAQPHTDKYAYTLSYFMPDTIHTMKSEVPTPAEVLGFQIGQQHADWGQVVDYMKALASCSNRVSMKETGRTYQHRPFIEVVITSEQNQQEIEDIRTKHLEISDVQKSASLPLKEMPVVISLIYSIHGNEPSGVNASLAVAYYLAAAEGSDIEQLLDSTIIVLTPGANPDGINRFASWVNSSRSLTDVYDLNSREFLEPWPSSRTNHYWADCNRDWLMAQHPEGINALNTYFEWLPNIVADQHEQGSARPFYFSPGDANRTHPLTSKLNQELTTEVSSYCALGLDKIGTGYYSKEGYDDYYYGKGAAYGDIHGSVCLLYEQGTSRGHLRMTVNGIRSFAWTIRNQALASFATIQAGYQMRERLLTYQKVFYQQCDISAKKESVKGYVFNTRGSKAVAFHFFENLRRHHIDVYHLANDYAEFKKEDSYIIPTDQRYSTMVKAIMENTLSFEDSIFYDISAWTFPHAFNLNYAPLKAIGTLIGNRITDNEFPQGRVIGGKSSYCYLFECKEYYAHKVIYELQKKGLYLNVCSRPFQFHSGNLKKQMSRGTIQVMVQNQPINEDELYHLIARLAKETGVDIYGATTGLMEETDLFSPSYLPIRMPKVALIVGRTMGIPDSGEIWHLLDQRFQMRPVLIENTVLTSKKLQNYNVIILANGTPSLSKGSTEALKQWIADGGTLIATGKAYTWVKEEGILTVETKSTHLKKDSTLYLSYEEKKGTETASSIPGTILNCHIDPTHPLAWGLEQNEIAIMKKGGIIFKKDKDPYVSPLHYTSNPRLSGFLSDHLNKLIKDTPALFAKSYKSGHVILFADDMNFRSYWFGTSKLFMNAIFFSECIK